MEERGCRETDEEGGVVQQQASLLDTGVFTLRDNVPMRLALFGKLYHKQIPPHHSPCSSVIG